MSKYVLLMLSLGFVLLFTGCPNPAGETTNVSYLSGTHSVKWEVTGSGDIDGTSTGDFNYLIVQSTIGLTPANANLTTIMNYGSMPYSKTYDIAFTGAGVTLYGYADCDLTGTGTLTLSLYIDGALVKSKSVTHTFPAYSNIEVSFTTDKL